MSGKYTLNDLKWLWVQWLQSIEWGDQLKELVVHNTWKPNCECFVCWLESQEAKQKDMLNKF